MKKLSHVRSQLWHKVLHAHLLYGFELLRKMCCPFSHTVLLCSLRDISPVLKLINGSENACINERHYEWILWNSEYNPVHITTHNVIQNQSGWKKNSYGPELLFSLQEIFWCLPRTSSSVWPFFLEVFVPNWRTTEPRPSSSSLNRLASLGSNVDRHRSSLEEVRDKTLKLVALFFCSCHVQAHKIPWVENSSGVIMSVS